MRQEVGARGSMAHYIELQTHALCLATLLGRASERENERTNERTKEVEEAAYQLASFSLAFATYSCYFGLPHNFLSRGPQPNRRQILRNVFSGAPPRQLEIWCHAPKTRARASLLLRCVNCCCCCCCRSCPVATRRSRLPWTWSSCSFGCARAHRKHKEKESSTEF